MAGGETSIFNEKVARDYETWYETREGRYFDSREKELILKLLKPRCGEGLVDIGCGCGHFLKWFKIFGLHISGVDNSKAMLALARRDLAKEVELKVAPAESLPFPDNKFDIATLITTLEFLDKLEEALREALRVASNRIFLGVLNKYSLLSLKRRMKGLFKDSVYNQARFYSIRELVSLVKNIDSTLDISWEMTGGRLGPRSPFGAFIGVLVKKK